MDFKKRLVTTILALNVLINTLSACQSSEKYDTTKPSITYEDTTDDKILTIITSPYDGLTLNTDDQAFLSQTFTIDETDYDKQIIKDIPVNYPYQELYTEQYIGITPNLTNEDYLSNLLNTILQNNTAYQNRYHNNNYEATTDEFVKKIVDLIITEINDLGDTLDLRVVNNNLKNLKIFSTKGYVNGFYNQKNGVLGINENLLSSYDEDTLKDVIIHEIIHMLMGANEEELENSNYTERIGYLYKEDDKKINPYYWNWFLESSAESLSYEKTDLESPFVYATGIKTLETMRLANFDTTKDLENTLFTNDINTLYEYYSELDPSEVNAMFYAYNLVFNGLTGESLDFYQVLKEKGISIPSSEQDGFETSIKGDVCLSLSKVFYQNLLDKIVGKEVSVNDIFECISIFELEVSRQTWYQSKNAYLEDFLTGYNTIQEYFFNIMASKLGVDTNYIKELYYMFNKDVTLNNINISFLSNAENEYFNYINESRTGNKKDAILKVYSDNYQVNQER